MKLTGIRNFCWRLIRCLLSRWHGRRLRLKRMWRRIGSRRWRIFRLQIPCSRSSLLMMRWFMVMSSSVFRRKLQLSTNPKHSRLEEIARPEARKTKLRIFRPLWAHKTGTDDSNSCSICTSSMWTTPTLTKLCLLMTPANSSTNSKRSKLKVSSTSCAYRIWSSSMKICVKWRRKDAASGTQNTLNNWSINSRLRRILKSKSLSSISWKKLVRVCSFLMILRGAATTWISMKCWRSYELRSLRLWHRCLISMEICRKTRTCLKRAS